MFCKLLLNIGIRQKSFPSISIHCHAQRYTSETLFNFFFSLSLHLSDRGKEQQWSINVCVCELCGHMVLLEYEVSPVIYIFFLRFTGMIRTKATRHNGTPNISFLRLQIFIVIISRIVAAVLVAIRPNFSPFRWETVAKFLWGKWNGTQPWLYKSPVSTEQMSRTMYECKCLNNFSWSTIYKAPEWHRFERNSANERARHLLAAFDTQTCILPDLTHSME